jgi:hypothetical protein
MVLTPAALFAIELSLNPKNPVLLFAVPTLVL